MKPKLKMQLGVWFCFMNKRFGGAGLTPAEAYHAFKLREAQLTSNSFINPEHPYGGRQPAGFFDNAEAA